MQEKLGERIRTLRQAAGMSSRDLAARADVDGSLIRMLEAGSRDSASVGTLQAIARALDVSLPDLFAAPRGLPSEQENAGVIALRRAVTAVDDLLGTPEDPSTPLTLIAARRQVEYAWGAYWGGRYKLLTTTLPVQLAQLRATARSLEARADGALARELYARLLWVSGCVLTHLGQPDAAYIAIRDALPQAQRGTDPLLLATLRGSLGWQLLVQGRYSESERVVLHAAAELEPHGAVTEAHESVRGSLLLQAATAAGRAQRPGAALDYATTAGEIAERTGDTDHYECNFGPSQVVMQTTDIHLSCENFTQALDAAALMPARGLALTQVSQARHWVDKAAALARLGGHQDEGARCLLTAERIGGPEWLPHQSLFKTVLGELRTQARPAALEDLARRAGV